jgi:hypothetical protein
MTSQGARTCSARPEYFPTTWWNSVFCCFQFRLVRRKKECRHQSDSYLAD